MSWLDTYLDRCIAFDQAEKQWTHSKEWTYWFRIRGSLVAFPLVVLRFFVRMPLQHALLRRACPLLLAAQGTDRKVEVKLRSWVPFFDATFAGAILIVKPERDAEHVTVQLGEAYWMDLAWLYAFLLPATFALLFSQVQETLWGKVAVAALVHLGIIRVAFWEIPRLVAWSKRRRERLRLTIPLTPAPASVESSDQAVAVVGPSHQVAQPEGSPSALALRHGDFYIGLEFFTTTGAWRCTDVGTRTIAAIRLDPDGPPGHEGPPYAVAEEVFDEHDLPGCVLLPFPADASEEEASTKG